MHRDIKLENVVVSAIGGSVLTVKLANFASAPTLLRTKGYMAPEIRPKKLYDHSIDIWSLGITKHTVLIGKVPSNGKLTIYRLSPVGKDFLMQMLQKDPQTAKQLLGHFWFMDHSTLTQFVKLLLSICQEKALIRKSLMSCHLT
ncbi:hypothetical protein THRCLA_22318 [Thraustotheca clavata]|uniref:Protein kinase domain-containing protein n=1 Tax=Thraustotheca clavata TaxID=74557 RepID=A0A1V9Z5L7_9STRA|nr:hypothetical protein THRCLA_22318 [Thraustotheca clavata]